MKQEVVIINGEPKNVYNNGKDLENGFTDWVMKQWDNPTGIHREPQYAAINVKGTDSIRVTIEVDSKKSKLNKGLIVQQRVIPVFILIRYGNDRLEGIRYTTFRKLVTHKTTDDLQSSSKRNTRKRKRFRDGSHAIETVRPRQKSCRHGKYPHHSFWISD